VVILITNTEQLFYLTTVAGYITSACLTYETTTRLKERVRRDACLRAHGQQFSALFKYGV